MNRNLGIAIMAAIATIVGAGAVMSAKAAEDLRETLPGHLLYGDPGVPDISGLWLGTYTIPPDMKLEQRVLEPYEMTRWAPWPPPYKPSYQKLFDEIVTTRKNGKQLIDIGAQCRPFGMPVAFVGKVFPEELVQTPGQISLLLYGNTPPIVIWTDGRPHPKDLKPSYSGHSIGYWVGDTLHVDTVGILAITPLDLLPRPPHSDKLRVETTIRLVDENTLHLHVTAYDEDAFTEPMVTTNIWRRKTGSRWQPLDDFSCFEKNLRVPAPSSGFIKF